MQKNSIVSYGSHQSDLNNFMTLIKRDNQKMRQPNYNYLYVWLLDCSVIIDVTSFAFVLLAAMLGAGLKKFACFYYGLYLFSTIHE